jgi:hypothetical protein
MYSGPSCPDHPFFTELMSTSHGPPVDLCQTPRSATPLVRNDYVCIRGQVVLIVPSSQSWAMWRSTPGSGGVLAHGADLNFGSGPIPSREGFDSPWASPLKFTFVYLYQYLILNARMFLRRVSGIHAAPHGGHLT